MSSKARIPYQKRDPFYKRECEKYADPIPSREFILQILEEFAKPVKLDKLIESLVIEENSDKHDALGFRLKAMTRDGQIMQDRRGRYCLFQKINLKHGKIHAHPEGYGFFIAEDDTPDMMLSPREMRSVMHGDIVFAYQVGIDRRQRLEGKVHEIIEHANPTVVGRYFLHEGVGHLVPDSKRLTQDIVIPGNFAGGATDGQIVLAEIVAYPDKYIQAVGKIVHILGEHMAPGIEIEVAILAHNLPYLWPCDVKQDVSKIPMSVSNDEIKDRKDLRNLNFVTIDGEDAKDFDDAVYCEKKIKGGFLLYVAIADVSHYVKRDSALDKEAIKRGNSVYFPEKVVPMLPEELSNGLCSLNPDVDRLCMVAQMSISSEGKLTNSKFYRAVIHSKARLTYGLVNKWLTENKVDKEYSYIWTELQNLDELYHVLKVMRNKRGAIDFDTTETRIEFDENRKIQKIVPVIRNDAHRLIEECMLVANLATAKFLQKHKIPSLYRVHPTPEPDKISALRQFLNELGFSLGGGKKPTPKDFQKTLDSVSERPEKHLIETVMLRSLKQAQYLESNDGHFGLAYPAYTHFTSPIRRYPDLLVHRAIGHILDNKQINEFAYTEDDMSTFGKHCSLTERRADEATREVISWLKCEYMQDKLGQVFTGRISAITGFGIFVELEDIYVEGLVHVTSLKSDYYTFDAAKHRLLGERSGQTFLLGDKMTVLVARVDLNERKIDFEPVDIDDE